MSTAIQQFLLQLETTYQEQDAQLLARLHHPNARYARLSGGYAVGRDEIRDYLPEIFDAAPEGIKSETISREVEQITPDLAVIDTRIQHFEVKDGALEPRSIEGFTTVIVRESGEWLVAAIRGALVPKMS